MDFLFFLKGISLKKYPIRKGICFLLVFLPFLTNAEYKPQTAITIDGITITPGKFAYNHNIVSKTSFDLQSNTLTLRTETSNLEFSGEDYEMYMKLGDYECRDKMEYDKISGLYDISCEFIANIQDISILRDLEIEVYKYHIKGYRLKEITTLPLNLEILGDKQELDFNNLKSDIILSNPECNIKEKKCIYDLEFFLRLEEVEYTPTSDYEFEITVFTPGGYNFIDKKEIFFQYNKTEREFYNTFKKRFTISTKYGEVESLLTTIYVYEVKDNKRIKKPIFVEDINSYLSVYESIDDLRTSYKAKNIKNIQQKQEESTIEYPDDNSKERIIDSKLQKKVNSVLEKLEGKYSQSEYPQILLTLKEKLQEYGDKNSKYIQVIQDINYIIDIKLESIK